MNPGIHGNAGTSAGICSSINKSIINMNINIASFFFLIFFNNCFSRFLNRSASESLFLIFWSRSGRI